MQASTRVILFCVLVFISTICNCCDILNYSSFCIDERMSITVLFENSFDGTIFASGHLGNPDGYIGNPNCSSENMEISSTHEVTFNLSFMDCNTRIKRAEGENHFQAINTVTVQYHPLIKSEFDCQVTVKCDIDYHLSSDFLTQYLMRDLVPLITIKSKLDIMSGEKLLGANIPSKVGKKQFLVLNVTDGNKYDHLRIRKCYSHAKMVIDQLSTPDLLLDNNICSKEGFLDSLYLKYLTVDKFYSDLRDFSEIQNFEVSFSQKHFYITCAFDLCSDLCSNYCIGEIEVNKSHWSTVRTHKVELLDESFKGFRNPQNDLRKSIKILYGRLLKLKNKQTVLKNSTDSKRKILQLDEMEHMTNDNVSATSLENNSTGLEKSNKQIQFAKEKYRKYDTETSEDESLLIQDADEISPENINQNIHLNISEEKPDEYFVRRSDFRAKDLNEAISRRYRKLKSAESDTTDEITTNNAESFEDAVSIINAISANSTKPKALNTDVEFSIISVDSSEHEMNADDPSEIPMNGCVYASCNLKEDSLNLERNKSSSSLKEDQSGTSKTLISDFFNTSHKSENGTAFENSINSNRTPEENSFQLDGKVRDISVFNFTTSNNDKSAEKDCVPYLKFASVTASLSLLCVSFFLITLFLSLYIRKEKKRRNNVSYLYRHF